jgi:protoporphyrinogen oxidase
VTQRSSVIVIGAGPAGLTAAYESTRRGFSPIVVEKANQVGGLSRTEVYRGYRFDIGGHRFYTQLEEIRQLWQEMLGEQFIKVSRLSHIYYSGRFFHYPLDFFDTLFNLGPIESALAALSYLWSRVWPYPEEKTFEQWVSNRFGRRLYRTFFKAYTEKVWGIPCDQIQAHWAAQRIKGLSMKTAITNALFGNNDVKSLVNEFHYPAQGSGLMWQRLQKAVEGQGGEVLLGADAVGLKRNGERIARVVVRQNGEVREFAGDHVISSMPLTELVARLDPLPPDDVVQAARGLRYRDFILVGLIIDRREVLRDNWLYVHSPEVKVGRIQNYKNWSAAMVPDLDKTSLGMEYFCAEGDALWCMADADLIALATREIVDLGLAEAAEVKDGVVIRQPKAYPVYDGQYTQHLPVIRRFLATVNNLQVIGRNGMHRYNNQDHSMLTGLLAVGNLLGQSHDLWNVNVERSYHEKALIE